MIKVFKMENLTHEPTTLHSVPPKYGLKLKLDHVYPEKKHPNTRHKWGQVVSLIPLSLRYLGYYWKCKIRGKKPVMDFINLQKAQNIYGCPLGGIGTGTIGRGFKGEFCRYQLRPGIYDYISFPENQFIVNVRDESDKTIFQSVMSTYSKPKNAPASWEWNLKGADCEYTGLYPRAWTTYDLSQYGVKLVCRQISPVIPHNYKDSSLPCAVFIWDIINVCSKRRSVSITFTFRDACLTKNKKNDKEPMDFERYSDNHTCGVSLETNISDMPCIFTIAKRTQQQDSTTDGFCKFNTKKTTSHVWSCLNSKGRLIPNEIPTIPNNTANAMGLSSQVTLEAGAVSTFEFCLVWDMPIIHFGNKKHKFMRYYTRFFGSEGIAGPSIATYALLTYKKWEEDINEWQNPILEDESLPSWYKGALMNELYYIADGGSVWFDVSNTYPRDDPRWMYGVFGYLEGHEYRMYNTYDVHFYASFALAQLWPRLQISLQYYFKETITKELNDSQRLLYSGTTSKRKHGNSVPHDLGDPEEDPFVLINAYNIHNVSEWRDLNLKFILQVFRDLALLRSEKMHQSLVDKYQSLEYIDDISDSEEDLYFRSTNQKSEALLNSDEIMLNHILSHKSKMRQMNGYCKPEGDFKLNTFVPREKHVSICSTEHADDDSDHIKHPHLIRQNSGGKPFLFHTQVSQCSESMVEAALVEDVVDAERYLSDMYPICRTLIDKILTWDADGDGLIENTGSPDQTFDAWVMSGPSAYCGGLWLAALHCMYTMACFQGIQEDINFFTKILKKATSSFDSTLWNGNYYDFDKHSKVIMADQLCGHWYLRACGFQYPIFSKNKVLSTLRNIYENNVLKFGNGLLGAVNGFIPSTGDKAGHVDYSSVQSEESWTGVTYGLSALMLHEGMTEEAFKTAGGMYNTLCHSFGMSFETPEALYENGNYRSISYMRPLAIWAMQHALKIKPLKH